MIELTRDALIDAFADMGRRAEADGRCIDLAVYGGSGLMLASDTRRTTRDVDAVALNDADYALDLARAVGAARGWPEDWLNDGVRTYLSPRVDGTEDHGLFASYPSETKPGLRVFVPSQAYLLAMKLMALRIDPAEGREDLADIVTLARSLGVTHKAQLIEFAADFYPEARVSGKLILSLDRIWAAIEGGIP